MIILTPVLKKREFKNYTKLDQDLLKIILLARILAGKDGMLKKEPN